MYCNDLVSLIDEIVHFRNRQMSDVMIRDGVDGGGGFMKISLSVFDINRPISQLSKIAKKYKDSGVKKVFLIACSPGLPENYINVKKLWLATGLHKLRYKFTISTDLKLCNILLGLQNHSSLHLCCWCEVSKHHLEKKGKPRTYASLIELFLNHDDAQVNKKYATQFGNVIHVRIVEDEDSDTPVINKVPPPELHLLLGPTNHLLDELPKVWPECNAWLQSIHVTRCDYFGGSFEGNECKIILNKLGSLREKCPAKFSQFVTTLKLFDEVVSSCYGFELARDFLKKIVAFKTAYLKLPISVTPKVHAVFYHIPEFCLLSR